MASFAANLTIYQWNGPKQERAPAISPKDWEYHREEISQLYKTMKLKDVMFRMETKHDFGPSRSQYIQQLKKWNCGKYNKSKNLPVSEATLSPLTNGSVVDIASGDILSTTSDGQDFVTVERPGATDGRRDPVGHVFDPEFIAMDELLEPMSPERTDGGVDAPWPDPRVSLEDQLDDLLKCFGQENVVVKQYLVDDLTATPSRGKHETVDARPSIPTPHRWSSFLKRVSPAQKRQRSGSSMHGNGKRVKNVDDHDRSDVDEAEEDAMILMDLSDVENEVQDSVVNFDISLPFSGSPHEKSESEMELGKTPFENNLLKRLLELAKGGGTLSNNGHKTMSTVEKVAGFFFGAELHEEAFLLYLLIYKTLKKGPSTTKDVLFPIVINMARSSTTDEHDQIVRPLLLSTSRKYHRGQPGEPQKNFLLNAFLTIVSRRQKTLSQADHHCHRAREYYEGSVGINHKLMNQWRSLSTVAWTYLGFNLTEKRLKLSECEISTEIRRKICSRSSDQLIMSYDSFWATEKALSENTCVITGPGVQSDGSYGPQEAQPSALRALFEWCLHTLEHAPPKFDTNQLWRKFRAEGMKLRSIGMTTIYCQLWAHWQAEDAENPLTCTPSDSWRVKIEDELGISANECLATIPDVIAVVWPFDDEDMPLLANWRTYRVELGRRTAEGLGRLLKEKNEMIAHRFFEAYAGRCIAQRGDWDWDGELGVKRRLRRECVLAFAAGHVDLQQLPAVDRRELVVHRPGSPLGPVTEEPEVEPLERRTEMPDARSEASAHPADKKPPPPPTTTSMTMKQIIHLQESCQSPSRAASPTSNSLPQHHDSVTSRGTVSSDVASMRSIYLRNRLGKKDGKQSSTQEPLKPPSSAIQDTMDLDFSLERMLGLARSSMESMSISGTGSLGEKEAESLSRMLSERLSKSERVAGRDVM